MCVMHVCIGMCVYIYIYIYIYVCIVCMYAWVGLLHIVMLHNVGVDYRHNWLHACACIRVCMWPAFVTAYMAAADAGSLLAP